MTSLGVAEAFAPVRAAGPPTGVSLVVTVDGGVAPQPDSGPPQAIERSREVVRITRVLTMDGGRKLTLG